ncbi:MAG: MazG nucleotide pyrophosphohydrolase domain-containing protein [Candidatus Latescibacterota bacterium]
MLNRLWELSAGMTRRFPEGDSPFRIVTRLMEECGELAEQVNHFEDTGVKRPKLGEPDRTKLAKEVQDVIRCALQIAQHYGIRDELEASVDGAYRRLKAEGLVVD